MRRAVHFLALAAFLSLTPAALRAGTVLDGAGMIYYAAEPNFKVGDWVKYHTKGSSLQGHKDDYVVTILIAGEELWWGERCFWVETWTEMPGHEGKELAASLVTYGIFGDSMATEHLTWFMRKSIEGRDDRGNVQQMIHKRDPAEFRARAAMIQKAALDRDIDTVGVATVTGPTGTYEARRIRQSTKAVELVDRGDSTIYYEHIETRDRYYSPKVPITWMAREEIDDLQQGRSWLIGNKKDAPLAILERARGTTELVGFGHGDVTPEVVPVPLRRTIEEQERERDRAQRAPAPQRRGTRKGGRAG
jgi:hypothetical protein